LNPGQLIALKWLALLAGAPAVILATWRVPHGAGSVLIPLLIVWLPVALLALAATLWLTYRALSSTHQEPEGQRKVRYALTAVSALVALSLWLKW
jgi:hypothetical protein